MALSKILLFGSCGGAVLVLNCAKLHLRFVNWAQHVCLLMLPIHGECLVRGITICRFDSFLIHAKMLYLVLFCSVTA
jgi:hypothetical protein